MHSTTIGVRRRTVLGGGIATLIATVVEREYAYDRQSHIGKLDKARDEAIQRGWLVVDMKTDWRVIHPFQR